MQEKRIGHDAKEYNESMDAAEKRLGVEKWCKVGIIRSTPNGDELLYSYDEPRDLLWKWRWVYEWRKARFVNKYPRDNVRLVFSFYDKNTGLECGFNALRSRQIAAHALITRYENKLKSIKKIAAGQLFVDETTAKIIQHVEDNIANAKARAEALDKEVESMKNKPEPAKSPPSKSLL